MPNKLYNNTEPHSNVRDNLCEVQAEATVLFQRKFPFSHFVPARTGGWGMGPCGSMSELRCDLLTPSAPRDDESKR